MPASEPPSGRLSNYERMESIVSSHSKEGWYMIHWLRKWHLQRTCEDQRHVLMWTEWTRKTEWIEPSSFYRKWFFKTVIQQSFWIGRCTLWIAGSGFMIDRGMVIECGIVWIVTHVICFWRLNDHFMGIEKQIENLLFFRSLLIQVNKERIRKRSHLPADSDRGRALKKKNK